MPAGMAPASPVTTKWKVVGNVDTAPWVWVVIAVVVVAVIVLLFLSGGRRRKAMQEKRDQEHREKAAEIRHQAENMELDAREREAKAIRARADAEQAQVDAARLRQEAEERSREAQSLRSDVAGHTRKADELDPDVGRDGTRRGVREAYEDRQAQAQAGNRDVQGVRDGRVAESAVPAQDAAREPGRREGDAADVGHNAGARREASRGEAPIEDDRGDAAGAADTGRAVHDDTEPRTGI
jgi:heme exporter protein D